MKLSSDIKRAFRCGICWNDLRLVPAEPTNACVNCGGRAWSELSDEDREKLWSILGRRKDHSKARVFICYRCRGDKRIHWNGEPINDTPCRECGSRYFSEIIGEERSRILAREGG